ncbi:MAG: HYC_CC_PP family protein [Bacteroidota bacterium]
MKKLKTLGALVLALLVLLASTHFFVDVHYCGDRLKAVSFLSEADGCGHSELPPCHGNLMKGCCENEQITHDAQDLKKEVVEVQVPTTFGDLVENTPLAVEVIPAVVRPKTFIASDPPLPVTNRQALFSVFLI